MIIHIVPASKKTLTLLSSKLPRWAGCHDGNGRNVGFGVTPCLCPLLTLTEEGTYL